MQYLWFCDHSNKCLFLVIQQADVLLNFFVTWWRHQMETLSALLALCAGNSPVPVNSPHKGQWRGALMFSLICARIHDWVNNREAGDLRRHRGHYDVIVMRLQQFRGKQRVSRVLLNKINMYHINNAQRHFTHRVHWIIPCATCFVFIWHRSLYACISPNVSSL